METLPFSIIGNPSFLKPFLSSSRRSPFHTRIGVRRISAVKRVNSRESDAYFSTDSRPIMLFDGVCNLCNGGVKFIRDNDTMKRMQGTQLVGPFPSSLSKLTQLTNLRISDIATNISSLSFLRSMTKLTQLVLRNNKLSGQIPSFIADMKNLQLLDLSFNYFTGSIPSSFQNLGSLEFLFLGNNNLSGELPKQINSSLQVVDLSYNQFSGTLPAWLNNNELQVKLRYEALQSDAGRALLVRSGRLPDDISSVVLVEKQRSFIKSEAVLRILSYLNFPYPQISIFLHLVPLFLRDIVYDSVADNRYEIFGKTDSCEIS